jgi:hypothetical protein
LAGLSPVLHLTVSLNFPLLYYFVVRIAKVRKESNTKIPALRVRLQLAMSNFFSSNRPRRIRGLLTAQSPFGDSEGDEKLNENDWTLLPN